MSVDRMSKDGIEVAEYLRTRLHKGKIEGGGHFAFLSMRDRFLKEMVARVRPFAAKVESP
jgi:hypothetical protein